MISNEEFRAAMSRFASGVTVVTTRDKAGRDHGLTVSAFCSVSAEPPLVLVCINKETASHYAFLERGAFVVHVLADHHRHISEHFAEPSDDKFFGAPKLESAAGLPVLEGSLVTLECTLRDSHDSGDHTILVGEVDAVTIVDGKPLIYFHGDYREINEGP